MDKIFEFVQFISDSNTIDVDTVRTERASCRLRAVEEAPESGELRARPSDLGSEVVTDAGSPWLHLEPMTHILIPAMAAYTEPEDFVRLATTCKGVKTALKNHEGKWTMAHVTQATSVLGASALDYASVKTLALTQGSSSSPDLAPPVTFADDLPNCRTIWWRVKDAASVAKGDYIESVRFSVQGTTGMYLRLYPNGKAHSRPGYCSVYIGSEGSERDISLRVIIRGEAHIITQRLNAEYVDGFVNFADVSGPSDGSDLEVGLEVLCGVWDTHLAEMKLVSGTRKATWTIPRMEADSKSLVVGDRITSDTFSLEGLGEDACFVLYPKGDNVDQISNVGNFVNVGMFGSAEHDVTFRMSAGKVSKVMTACCDRYHANFTGKTKSCGEFFDSCFGELSELVDASGALRLTLDILDVEAEQFVSVRDSKASWSFSNAQKLILGLEGEALYSRYFQFRGYKNVFFSLGLVFNQGSPVTVIITLTNMRENCVGAEVSLRLRTTDFTSAESRVPCVFSGLRSTCVGQVEVPEGSLSDFCVDVELLNWVE